ncbi:MAG: zinc ribbon domain-containing protein [Thermoplasmata archaeon]
MENSDLNILDQVQSYLKKIKVQSEAIKQREKELNDRAKRIEEWEYKAKSTDEQLKKKEETINSKLSEIQKYTESLQNKEKEMKSKIDALNQKDTVIDDLTKKLNSYEVNMSKIKNAVADLEKSNNAMGNELKELINSYIEKRATYIENEKKIVKLYEDLSSYKDDLLKAVQKLAPKIEVPSEPVAPAPKYETVNVSIPAPKVEEEDLIPCPNCGTMISKDAIMCYACGFLLKPEALENSKAK